MVKVPVLGPNFAEAKALMTQKVIQILLNAICRVGLKKPSPTFTHMEQRTRKLLAPSYRPPVIVGVRGPTGAGNTSLVSGLLHTDNLAHTVRLDCPYL